MSVTRSGSIDDFLMFDMEMEGCSLISSSDQLEGLNKRIEEAVRRVSATISEEPAYAKTEIKATYKRHGLEIEDGRLVVDIVKTNDNLEYTKFIHYSTIADNVEGLAQQIMEVFSSYKVIFEKRKELLALVELASNNATKKIQQMEGYEFYSIDEELQINGAVENSILVLKLVQGNSFGFGMDSRNLGWLNYAEIPKRVEDLEVKILSLCEKFTKLSFTKKPSPSKT